MNQFDRYDDWKLDSGFGSADIVRFECEECKKEIDPDIEICVDCVIDSEE